MKTFFTLLVTLFLFSGSTFAAVCVSLGTGNWNTPSTWSCGTVPIGGDDITISAGHTVSITSVINVVGAATTLTINGILLFDATGSELRLPCGSTIYVSPTGSIQSGSGDLTTHAIRICRGDVWNGIDGTVTGPVIFGLPLPIELSFFDAQVNESMIDFSWQTISELNNSFFTIEGSVDVISWTEMHRIEGAGTTQEEQNYLYTSKNEDNYSYFRLKQTDLNGDFTYSDLVSVEIIRDQLKIYPNPNNGTVVNIELPSEKAGMMQILNSDGREVYSVEISGEQTMQLTDLNLNSGSYFVHIQQADCVQMKRLIIE